MISSAASHSIAAFAIAEVVHAQIVHADGLVCDPVAAHGAALPFRRQVQALDIASIIRATFVIVTSREETPRAHGCKE
jgi:hypothetical protein